MVNQHRRELREKYTHIKKTEPARPSIAFREYWTKPDGKGGEMTDDFHSDGKEQQNRNPNCLSLFNQIQCC